MGLNKTYKTRLNQWGTNPTDRLNNAREKNFEKFLAGSPHKVTFELEGESHSAVMEPYKQNQNHALMHLLTKVSFQPNPGDMIDVNGDIWMIYWLDEHKNKGYNRWIILRMSREVTWRNKDGQKHSSLAHLYGQEDNMLKNEIKSRSRSAALYQENLKLYFMVMPARGNIEYGSYLEVEESGFKEHFRVTGYDFLSTPGIVYVSMDPTPLQRDEDPSDGSSPSPGDDDPWLGGILDV